MSATLAATIAIGVVSAVSGWFTWQSGRARTSALGLILGGTALLVGSTGVVMDLDDVAATSFKLGGCLLLPLAVLAYPRLAWRDPLSFVLAVVLAGAGTLAVGWEASLQPMCFVIVVALLINTWWAIERSDTQDRRALTWSTLAWVGAGLTASFLGFFSEAAGASSFPDMDAVHLAILTVGPAAMAVGVVRPEVVDVRGLVTRAVVAGTVFIGYLAAAVGVIATFDAAGGKPLEGTPAVVVCALLAFGVWPSQVVLRGVVDQLLFGDRPDPLTAATSLADQIGDDPTVALDAIRTALVLPYASLRESGQVLASSGTEVTHLRALPLRLGDNEIVEIVVGLRAGDLSLSAADQNVLRIVAPLLAQTLRAQAMSRDLQQSREAVVAAVEEERLRLRRDLHDGLGPTLSGVAFATDAARNQLRGDPDRADELLVQLRADTTGAISEIRRLVEGLRPPALDELGLVGAVQQHAASLHSASGSPLTVSIDARTPLPRLPAAVEVAAYRIVLEALTNVVRHAEALHAAVHIHVLAGSLQLSVTDDGTTREAWKPGVGISSMRERAQQVGGTLHIMSSPQGGTVQAEIPLPTG